MYRGHRGDFYSDLAPGSFFCLEILNNTFESYALAGDVVRSRKFFGANLLTLTWIKGEPMAGGLIDEILRGLGLERETEQKSMQRRKSTFQALPGLSRSNSTESQVLRRGSSGQW